MSSTTTILSDCHISEDNERQANLVAFLDTREGLRVVLAGDIFDTWWGWGVSKPERYLPTLSAIERMLARGLEVVFIPGNHDFSAGPTLSQMGVRVVSRFVLSNTDGQCVVLHGDAFDQRLSQRLLNWVLRGWIGRLIMAVFPKNIGYRLASWLTGGADRTDSYDRGVQQRQLVQQQEWVFESLMPEVSYVFVGHTHAPGVTQRGQKFLVNLGDWTEHLSYAEIDDSAVRLLRWNFGNAATPILGEPRWRGE